MPLQPECPLCDHAECHVSATKPALIAMKAMLGVAEQPEAGTINKT